jgi:hypothetical protein
MRAAFRLNATSDIQYERFQINGRPLIAGIFSRLTFYDYTKIAGRQTPANYHLIYSLAETARSMREARAELARGRNVAVVFSGKLPSEYLGAPVVNGDEHDYIPADPVGVVRGLKAKGLARGDDSGFAVAV